MTPETPRWPVAILITSLVLSLVALGGAIHALDQSLPPWVEIEEGPVAHGIDKFYRKAVFMGDVAVQGDLGTTGTMALNEAAGTITTTQMLTPTASYYQLNPASEITLTLGSCTTAGQALILHNPTVTTTNIASTNLLPAAGVALGQNDAFVGLCTGAAWLKVHLQNN